MKNPQSDIRNPKLITGWVLDRSFNPD